jgi:hypothetical protein
VRLPPMPVRLLAVSAALIATGGVALGAVAPEPSTPATPGIACGPGSLPEQTQGRAPASDLESGRFARGYTCNVQEVSHTGKSGGYRVERYVDSSGNECAYYDSTLLWPSSVADQGTTGPGTYVLDMKDPAKPVVTDVLRTPAFQSPHESVRLNAERGLLVAAMGYPTTMPGQLDVFDVSQDCRRPQLLSSLPVGFLGHEGGFAPDGNTYYVGSLYFHTLTAVDLTEPRAPRTIWATTDYEPHGVSISDDGNTLYMAEAAFDDARGFSGLTVLDVTQVQERAVNPSVPLISRLTWDTVSTPQTAVPFTSKGRSYVMQTDEFGSGASIGAARIIDVQDITTPRVVSDIRLEVNRAEAQGPDLEADPGNNQAFQGYQAHYCSLPSRVDPKILACSFILSGLRVFDISDVSKPREIAYHNKPVVPGSVATSPRRAGSFAMSAPAYDEQTGDIWYSDGNSGFYVVRLTGPAKRPKFASRIENSGS